MTGAELLALREARGLTRRQACALAGVSLRTLQRVEQGRVWPPPGLVAWLRRVYSRRASGKS
jgi:transcriptional regulator with XRE-family HTH domain